MWQIISDIGFSVVAWIIREVGSDTNTVSILFLPEVKPFLSKKGVLYVIHPCWYTVPKRDSRILFMTKRTCLKWGAFAVLLFTAGFCRTSFGAEESEAQNRINPVPGVLATTSTSGANTRAVQGEFGGKGLFTGESQSILASLSKQGEEHWNVTLKNTTEDRFTLFLDLRQKDSSNRALSTASFSVELKPKATERRTFMRVSGASGAELFLRRYRNKTEESEARTKRRENR